VLKRTVGLEWPIYVFEPETHADLNKVDQRRREESRVSEDALIRNGN